MSRAGLALVTGDGDAGELGLVLVDPRRRSFAEIGAGIGNDDQDFLILRVDERVPDGRLKGVHNEFRRDRMFWLERNLFEQDLDRGFADRT